jgi:hypothetical protein
VSRALTSRMRAALALLAGLSALVLSSCTSGDEGANAAAKPVELARYLPENSVMVEAVDVAAARRELSLPEDANALPTSNKTFPREKSPEATLFQVTSKAYPDVSAVFLSEFNGNGASPLDGTLIRAAAGSGSVSIVSTSEPFEDIERKLKLAGYTSKGKLFVAGSATPEGASRFVADAGSGRFVFASDRADAADVLRRARREAKPGPAAKALQRASGSVRLASIEKGSPCVTAFAAAQEATGEGASLALIVSGDKPDPDRFNPKPFLGLNTGTPTVLVDALIIPISVKRPLKDGLDPITQALTILETSEPNAKDKVGNPPRLVAPPLASYDCP